MPDLQILLEGPHFITISGSCCEIKIGGCLLHILFGSLDSLLNLRACHLTDDRILQYGSKVGLKVTVHIG